MADVLVIDDELTVVELVRRCLETARLTVGVTTGDLSISDAVQREHPDVIVVGLMLPVQNAMQLCRTLRQFSSARVLMLTTRIDEIEADVDPNVGADDYLGKPFSPRELVARVRVLKAAKTTPLGGARGTLTPSH